MKSRPFEQLFSVGTGFCMGFLKSSKTDHNPFLFKNCKYKAKAAQIKRFKRLMLSGGLNPDILPWNPCTATACEFPAKNTRNFFEVLLTLFEPPAEFNADITRPAFGTHPAAILASVLLLSADR